MKRIIYFSLISLFLWSCTSESADSFNSTITGSYATLLTVGDFLYAINDSELTTFDISTTEDPMKVSIQDVGFDVENIFHQNGVLFIGSSSALHIFEIREDGIPKRVSQTDYELLEVWCSNDPVIVKGDYAYVTLSTTRINECNRFQNQNELRVYDVSDPSNPKLEFTEFVEFPKGLTIRDNTLFVCLEQSGFVMYDISVPNAPEFFNSELGFPAYDIIAKDDLLMVVSPEELRQYDISDVNDIIYLSSIDL